MYYHVIIETNTVVGKEKKFEKIYEFDLTSLEQIKNDLILPNLKREEIQFKGRYLDTKSIRSITLKKSTKEISALVTQAYEELSAGVFISYTPERIVDSRERTTDVTTEIFNECKLHLKEASATAVSSTVSKPESKISPSNERIFIVHGRDELAKTETARFVEKLGLTAIILHEQPNGGTTIIEKIEANTDVGFALILYTPCDLGKLKEDTDYKNRARQNVVFEHGFLMGKLGRKNVCALVKGSVETPNDISGVVYIPQDASGAWHVAVAKELRNAGYSIDMNKVF